jgi:hypothetical protein
MGSRQIVLVYTAGISVLNAGIFWREAKTKRLFSHCSSSTKSPRKKKKIKIVCNGIWTAATYKPGSRPMRDQYDGTAEYGFLEPLVESWPVNFPAEYGFRMSNAVDQRSIHHHFTWLTKAITIPETVHDDWVQARVDCDTFFGGIWLGLNTVYSKIEKDKKKLADRGRERGWARSQIIRPQERFFRYKSTNTPVC